MDENSYRRNVFHQGESESRNYGSRQGSSSYRSSSSGHRSHGSMSINLKTLKNTSLTCAKSLTNKLISLSNSGIQAASSAINTYKENAAAQAKRAAIANPNSFLRIAERITSTDDPVASHRELVAVIEHILIWPNSPIQLSLERDRYGLPTQESMKKVQLINITLLEKILRYVEGRRDCCLFIVKFITWRMRTTTKPEEVLLSLEFLQRCVERFGGFFLSLMTKSCMRRLRRLLRITKLTTSIAGGVKKQLTKLIIGSSNVHPGVSTDVRMHVIKAKVLYMVQLWHDVFLLEQGMYPVFFQGYREMRERGIKFPQVDVSERSKINMSPVIPKSRFVLGGNIVLPLSPEELDTILSTVQTMNTLGPGTEYDAAIKTLKESKARIVSSINTLAEKRAHATDPRQHEEILRRMLILNDCVGSHINMQATASKTSSQLLSHMGHGSDRAQCQSTRSASNDNSKVNLLDLDSSSESDNNDEFDKFFGSVESQPERKKSEDDYEKFFAEFGVFGTGDKEYEASDTPRSSQQRNYASDLYNLDFSKSMPRGSSNSVSVSAPGSFARSESVSHSESNGGKDLEREAFRTMSSDCGVQKDAMQAGQLQSSSLVQAKRSENQESTPAPAKEESQDKKSLSELMKDLDNMEHDFSHISVTKF